MTTLTRCAAFLLMFVTSVACARPPNADLSRKDLAVIGSSLFASAHPDLLFRISAIGSIEDGRVEDAFNELLKAAHYGDKPSQALIAEAYWSGTLNQGQDRPLAYAWMDLAAERGYPLLIGKRETYWAQLSRAQRKSALERGQAIYAEYGDDVALPRLDRELRSARREQTGTRTGAAAGSRAYLATSGVDMVVTFIARIRGQSIRPILRGGEEVDFWDDKFWHLDDYLAWKAEAVDSELTGKGKGRVDILPIKGDRDRS